MKVLIVDFHAGCIQALALSLEQLGHEVKVLSHSAHNFIFQTSALERWTLESPLKDELTRRIAITGRDVKRAVSESVLRGFAEARDSSPHFDLAICMFPPSLALAVHKSRVANKTIMMAAHRADLWISKPKDRSRFFQQIEELSAFENFSVNAVSEFDQRYLLSHLPSLNVDLTKLPAPHANFFADVKPTREETLTFGLGSLSRKHREDFVRSLPGPIVQAEEILPKGHSYSELFQFPNFAVVPYSVYSIRKLEIELSGRRLFIPEDEALVSSGSLRDVRLWPIYGRKSEIQRYSKETGDSLNVGSDEVLLDWLQFAQWKFSPNTIQAGPIEPEEFEDLATMAHRENELRMEALSFAVR